MNTEEILKQRKIGKYVMMANIIRDEYERIRRTGLISRISITELAKGASVENEEVEKIMRYCKLFDSLDMAYYAAREFFNSESSKYSDGEFHYVFNAGRRYGKLFILAQKDVQDRDLYKELAADNYDRYCESHDCPVSERFRDVDTFQKIIFSYEQYFCAVVSKALDEGYDWDVITAMLGYEIARERFTDLSKQFEGF